MKRKEKIDNVHSMKREIRLISSWCGVRMAYVSMMIVLVIESVIQMVYHEPVTALLILLAGILVPIPVSVWLRKVIIEEPSLEMTKRRYHYAYYKYKTYQIVNIFLLVLIILWKLSNNNSAIQNIRKDVFPVLVALCGILVRVGGEIYYNVVIPQRLKSNK